MVNSMEKWRHASEAMGSRIKAAYACAEFEQFLERAEKKELKRYKKEQAASSSSSSSSEGEE